MENSLEQARALIKAKRYDEARRLLKTINHPTAKQWLETIDALAPANASAYAKSSAAPDAAKASLNQAAELIKAKRYGEARRLLETFDHPKAREWLARLDAMPQPMTAEPVPALAAAVSAPVSTFKLRKPLPEIEEPKPPKNSGVSVFTLIVTVCLVAIVALLAFAAMKAGGIASIPASQIVTFAPIVIMLIIVAGLWLGMRPLFSSRLGFRLLVMCGALGAFAVTSYLNQQVRIPFNDPSLSVQYPGTWVVQALDKDEDCLDDPDYRRCLLVLENYTQGKTVWAILKEDTFDFDATLAEADDNHWSFMLEGGATLDKQWDTNIDGHPTMVRQYTFSDASGSDDTLWYSVRFFVMRDPRHLIRLSFITEKPEAVTALWGEIEGIYKSIQLNEEKA